MVFNQITLSRRFLSGFGGEELLDQKDLEKVNNLQTQLLELPRDLSRSAIRRTLEAIGEFVGSERAFASYFFDGELHFIEHNIGPEIAALLQDGFKGVDEEGYFLLADPQLEAVNRMRRASGSGVTHERHLIDRSELEKLDFYRNAFVPARMTHVIGMHARLPIGEAVFAFSFDGDDDPAFNDPLSETRLKLLLPCFDEAFNRLYERSRTFQRTRSAIDKLSFPAVITDLEGTIVERNDEAERLGMTSAGVDTDWLGKTPRFPGPLLQDGRASLIYFQPNEALQPATLAAKGEAIGLTKRQAQVAALMAQGMTDREISETLDISIHTVKRHCEAVLDRLAISSRSRVFLALAV